MTRLKLRWQLLRLEIDAIANNPEPATFENTIVAMEDAGRALNRLSAIFFVYTSNLNLGSIPDLEKAVVPEALRA